MNKLSTELQHYFFEEERPSKVTLSDILELSGERTFGFLLVLLSLPSALPVPAPGYSIPFGIVMFVLAVQLAMGAKTPLLPQRLAKRPLELKTIQGFLTKGIPWLQRLETICKPRLSFVCTSFAGRVIIGVAIALMSISMMIPIPGTNTLPAIGIFVTGFGLLDDDGAISVVGLVICLAALALSSSILIAVWFGGSSLLDLIKQWLGR
ncbi:MAG: exopolysaccharide biosynthesis protein [Oscillatoria sp. SIO1A7]|nr:exopolysaccharide biosynthesis protein [Oscillatoria sp. SIO1A7]